MKNLIKKIIVIVNIILPLLLGTWMYITSSEDVLFVRLFSNYTIKIQGLIGAESGLGIFCRNYFADFLWGYSLMFTIYYVLGTNGLEDIRLSKEEIERIMIDIQNGKKDKSFLYELVKQINERKKEIADDRHRQR